MNQPMQGWTPPPRPPSYQAPGQPGSGAIRPGRVFIGVGIALAAHLLTVGVAWVVAVLFASNNDEISQSGERLGLFLISATIAQVVLMIVALAVGITLAVRKDGGIGIGVIIGWAVGLVVSPVVGFGVCVAILGGAA